AMRRKLTSLKRSSMKKKTSRLLWVMSTVVTAYVAYVMSSAAQQAPSRQKPADAIEQAQHPQNAAMLRPEQDKTAHDTATIFSAANAKPESDISASQPKMGKVSGFDFYRDPLNSDRPNVNPDDIVKRESADKQKVMDAQRQLLEARYILSP